MPSLKDLLVEQRTTITMMTRILPNYRKIGKEKYSAIKTQNRIEALEKLWTDTKALHIRLQQTATDKELKEEVYFSYEEFFTAEEEYEASLDSLTEMLAKQRPTAPPSMTKSTDLSVVGELQGISVFALPRITIPAFKGDPTEWESFRDSFEALVGNNDALSKSQKLYFLKQFIEGEAAELIRHIKVSDNNYDAAWTTLKDEFDNSRALIHAHIHAFASLPPMKLESASELKRLRDVVNASISALRNLQRPVDNWSDLLTYMITHKFSARTRTEWNLRLGASNDYPTIKQLLEFMTEPIRGIAKPDASIDVNSTSGISKKNDKTKASVHNATGKRQCPNCPGTHFLAYCPGFGKRSTDERYQIAKQSRLCFNCLKPGHYPTQCPCEKRCSKCKKAHHTLLHRDFSSSPSDAETLVQSSSIPKAQTLPTTVNCVSLTKVTAANYDSSAPTIDKTILQTSVLHTRIVQPSPVLLATAIVILRTPEGRKVKARALLDQGSSYSFITESLAQTLHTSRRRAKLYVSGFGEQYSGVSKSQIRLTIESHNGQGPRVPLNAFVYQKLSAYAALKSRAIGSWQHLQGLFLANPDPTSNESIDLLIGADLYGHLLLGEIRKGPIGTPTGQLTMLGWIISGPTSNFGAKIEVTRVLNSIAVSDPDALLRKFWEIEELPEKCRLLTPAEEQCEKHFIDTHSRTAAGRYIVRLPFRDGPPIQIGDSFKKAMLLYQKLEQRLKNKPDMKREYDNFLSEYESMGHMEIARNESRFPPVYIPHHPVIRESSSTTRLRVVFNASSITTNGTTLNDHLLSGPKLQQDIAAIILKWRQHRFVYTADIAKMFRRILVHPDDVDFQRIVWRSRDTVDSYRLLTVTYGTAPAPYLSMRVLSQLANDEGESFPDAVSVLRRSLYVDDVLFGADDVEAAHQIREQLNALLNRGGFHLRKWASNDPALLEGIPAVKHELALEHPLNENDALKILGLTWLPCEDAFRFQVATLPILTHTKRSILSFIARLFDPLGWASPVIITAKILMQDLWLAKIDWDDNVPSEILKKWENYYENLSRLSEIRIPRWTGSFRQEHAFELHGFSDASERAYSAVIYLRALRSPNDIQVTLLTAKTKVAPLKTVSIPRLELNGALLLVKLLEFVRRSLDFDTTPVHGWTDSTVTLAWISEHPSRWKPYVANRVSEIQTRASDMKWHHVASHSNPADCASRGIPAQDYLEHSLWWQGPKWLSQPSVYWPDLQSAKKLDADCFRTSVAHEERKVATCHIAATREEWDLTTRYSDWAKLLRVTALVRSFVRQIHDRIAKKPASDSPNFSEKIKNARLFWIRYIQQTSFGLEIRALKKGSNLLKSSSLKALNSFLDGNEVLHLGGRLRHSFLSYDERFPIILPRHRLSALIAENAHRRALHGGTQLTLRVLRQNFWILGARSLIKSIANRCVPCLRERADTAQQLMGDLPPPRVTPSAPFSHAAWTTQVQL